jgi:hypothetical protein
VSLRHKLRVPESLVSVPIAAPFAVIGMVGAATPTRRANKLLAPHYQLDLPLAAAVPFAYAKRASQGRSTSRRTWPSIPPETSG